MLKAHGPQGGTDYDRHVEKIKQSSGYMRDGNVTHYVWVGYNHAKTRDRNRYGHVTIWSKRDRAIREAQMNEIKDYIGGDESKNKFGRI